MPENIIAKFCDTRLVPYDLEAVLSKLDIKLRTLILTGPFFTDVSLWVSQTLYIMAEAIS